MAREGPNQDINNPITLIDLAYKYQYVSDGHGIFLAQSIAQDPTATGSPIINVSIPFKKTDGSTELLYGSDISYDDGYIYNSGLVFNSTIVTYIDLAERFRNYWNILNNVLNQLNDFQTIVETSLDPEGPFVIDFGTLGIRTHGSLGGTSYQQTSYYHSPSQALLTPTWSGYGPTNYNYITYPQLLTELQNITISRTETSITYETVYWYDKLADTSGSLQGARATFGKDPDYAPIEEQYIQIYNNESTTMNVNLSIDISATFDSSCSVYCYSWAEIDDIDNYPDPPFGDKSLLSSYESNTVSGSGTVTLNIDRTIEIPAGKSAFIGGGATSFLFGVLIQIDITVILNDQTLIHSVTG